MNQLKNFCFKAFHFLTIKKEERVVAYTILLLILFLNGLLVWHYHDTLTLFSDDYHKMFRNGFNVSGFDAWTYTVISKWSATQYNIFRHPLLAVFMYIPYLINQLLMQWTGVNCAIYIVACMQVFFGFYSFVFFYRIVREGLGLSRAESSILSLLFFSFAYILLTVMVPDHFNCSMFILLFVLYVAIVREKKRRQMGIMQTWFFFFITAGVSLNNGLKVFMSALFANGKKFFQPKYFLLGIILPSAMIWGIARLEHNIFAVPEIEESQRQAKIRDKQIRDSLFHAYAMQNPQKDTIEIKRLVRKKVNELAYAKYMRDHHDKRRGQPIAKGEFIGWTDITTDREASIQENLFGESIQLHTDHLLDDILEGNRPMIVRYQYTYNYIVEGIIVVLFLLGFLCGLYIFLIHHLSSLSRRFPLVSSSAIGQFFLLMMTWFAMDMFIHVILGFGLNEVYIMSGHWLFIIPLTIAYLFLCTKGWTKHLLQILAGAVTIFLYIYNLSLIIGYFS